MNVKIVLSATSILFFFLNFNLAKGQQSDSIYFKSPVLLSCNIQLPNNYDSEKAIPLVICLHGGGSSYNSFKNIWKRFKMPQFIMATPQAPYKWLIGENIGYDWSAWPSGDIIFMQKAMGLLTAYIENLIESLTNTYPCSEIYLLGFSQGSIITQVAGINNHGLLNGLIILSGPELYHPGKPEIVWPSEETVEYAKHLRVFIAHGKSDEFVDIEFAYKSKLKYNNMGYDVTFFEFEGGHEINDKVIMEIEKWLSKEE